MRDAIRYSEAFKLQVLRELEEGKFTSRIGAARAYGISGVGMIQYWARKYGKDHLLGKVVRVETPKEVNEATALRKRVRELKKENTRLQKWERNTADWLMQLGIKLRIPDYRK